MRVYTANAIQSVMKGIATTKIAKEGRDPNKTTHAILLWHCVVRETCFFLSFKNQLRIDVKGFIANAMNNAQTGYIATRQSINVKKEKEVRLNAMSTMIFVSHLIQLDKMQRELQRIDVLMLNVLSISNAKADSAILILIGVVSIITTS